MRETTPETATNATTTHGDHGNPISGAYCQCQDCR